MRTKTKTAKHSQRSTTFGFKETTQEPKIVLLKYKSTCIVCLNKMNIGNKAWYNGSRVWHTKHKIHTKQGLEMLKTLPKHDPSDTEQE